MILVPGGLNVRVELGVLGALRERGVMLWMENGQLRYKAPRELVSEEELKWLRISRDRIISLLGHPSDVGPPNAVHTKAPLTFSQCSHWHLYGLAKRRAIRQIASATHIRGLLNVDEMRRSVERVVDRHESLRTTIQIRDGLLVQEVGDLERIQFSVEDLTTVPDELRRAEVIRHIEEHILEPIDVSTGPLFGVRLLKLDGHEHVLIVAMEHMISDAFSMGILLRDLFAFYAHGLTGAMPDLPGIAIQFADYAIVQRLSQRIWWNDHGPYWNELRKGAVRMSFPDDPNLTNAACSGWETIGVHMAAGLRTALHEWCRARRTTLALGVFTAYAALVMRLLDTSESIIQFQSDSRDAVGIENTIGYFSTAIYIRLRLGEQDRFVDLLQQVTRQYCEAYEHADASRAPAEIPRPGFTRNSHFNWVPVSPGGVSWLADSKDAIECSSISFEHPMLRTVEWDYEPLILLFDSGSEISGGISFPRNRFTAGTIKRFEVGFMSIVNEMLRSPECKVRDVPLELWG